MAKKKRFPLEMKDGSLVKTLHELMEHFDLDRVVSYLEDGTLEVWLRDRMQGEMADAVSGLDLSDDELGRKVCEFFFRFHPLLPIRTIYMTCWRRVTTRFIFWGMSLKFHWNRRRLHTSDSIIP